MTFHRALVFFSVVVLSVASCAPDRVTPRKTIPYDSIDASPSPEPTREDMWCERVYTENSIWNLPIDWSRAKIHPDSEVMMDAFFKDYGWMGTDPDQYAPNIYIVSNATPLVPVMMRENRFRDAIDDVEIQYGEPAGIVWMPLPIDARPSPGSDGQLAIINVETGEEWGMNKGMVDSQGNWSAGGVYRYHINNSGIPPDGFAQRGAGIGQLAGIVRSCEIERGYIGHAVTIAYDYPCAPDICRANGWPEVVSPFKKTDGKGTSKYDIPEGTRLVIRPEISRKDILSACGGIKGCVVWAENMQEFGGFIVDNSGHPKTYAEGTATANWDSQIWSEGILSGIPSEWYAVIDWSYPSTKVQK